MYPTPGQKEPCRIRTQGRHCRDANDAAAHIDAAHLRSLPIEETQNDRQRRKTGSEVTREATPANLQRLRGDSVFQKPSLSISQDGNRTRTTLYGSRDFKSRASACFATWPEMHVKGLGVANTPKQPWSH